MPKVCAWGVKKTLNSILRLIPSRSSPVATSAVAAVLTRSIPGMYFLVMPFLAIVLMFGTHFALDPSDVHHELHKSIWPRRLPVHRLEVRESVFPHR